MHVAPVSRINTSSVTETGAQKRSEFIVYSLSYLASPLKMKQRFGTARKAPRAAIELVAYPGEMGEAIAKACSFRRVAFGSYMPGATTAADTQRGRRERADRGVELIFCAGGDGTARDIYESIGDRVTVVGNRSPDAAPIEPA